ncbi:CBS domain-containing protein [uncultured Dubosiella sp.]|uniref:CBS domain-containing protein n=1 Tax=Dubosiella muris TaxID=3038133 RepID=A0AC61RAB9_9FIRM|nr:CBS domain-containing protein [uncultured Dubosiella sp.]TGY67203.1 CBS domain-containing protein [Dubosiella muris]
MEQNIFFFLKNKKNTHYLYGNLSFGEGLRIFRESGFTATPVIDYQGHYLGSVTEGDFLYYITDHPHITHEQISTVEISELVRDGFMPAVPFNISMSELFNRSLEQNYVPVVDDRNIFIGIVTRKTIISYLMTHHSADLSPYQNALQKKDAGPQKLNPIFTLR